MTKRTNVKDELGWEHKRCTFNETQRTRRNPLSVISVPPCFNSLTKELRNN